MNINILSPKKAVESAFERPSLALALVLVALPAIASLAGSALYGVAIEASQAIFSIVLSYISFFILTLVVFALAMLLNSKATKGRFLGLFSALSLTQIVTLAIVLLGLLLLPVVLSPEAIDFALQAGKSASEEIAVSQINGFIEANPGAINWTAFNALMSVGVVLLVFAAYILFLSVKRLAETSSLAAILLTAIAFIVAGALAV